MLQSKLYKVLLTLPRKQQAQPWVYLGQCIPILLETPSLNLYSSARKRRKVEPIPRNAFTHVVEKVYHFVLVEYRSNICFRVWSRKKKHVNSIRCGFSKLLPKYLTYIRTNSFFSGCHLFIPVFDPLYDSYDNLCTRTPWCFDAVLAVAAKVKYGSGPPTATFYRCLEEAHDGPRSDIL